MSYKLYDYICPNSFCQKSLEPEELLANSDEVLTCERCSADLQRLMPAPKGYVSLFDARRYRKRQNGDR